MERRLVVTIACLLVASSPVSASAPDLYQALSSRIGKGNVRARLELSPKTTWIGGVRIRIARDASATLVFAIRADDVVHGTATFSPPLEVTARGFDVDIQALAFGADGHATELRFGPKSAGVSVTSELTAYVLKALRVSKSASWLLAGRLFTGARCTDPWRACRDATDIVERVQWSSEHGPVVLAPGPWPFARTDAQSCFALETIAPTTATIVEASYEPLSRHALVSMTAGSLTIASGCLGIDRAALRLTLASRSHTRLGEVYAVRTAAVDTVRVRLDDGAIAFTEAEILLAQDQSGPASIRASSGSLEPGESGLRVIVDRDRLVEVTLGTDAVIAAEVSHGRIGLWASSFARLQQGRVHMPLTSAVWTAGRAPQVVSDQGTVSFELAIAPGGVARPTFDSLLTLVGGRLAASAASFDSQAGARFFGPYTAASFQAAAGSRFMVDRGFVVDKLVRQTQIDAIDPAEPLVLARDSSLPTGRFTFKGEAELISSATDQAMSCEHATYEVDVFLGEERFELRAPLACKGTSTTRLEGNTLTMHAELKLQRLALERGVIGGEGTFAVTVPPSNAAISVDGTGPMAAPPATIWTRPITLWLHSRANLTFAAPFSIVNGRINFAPPDAVIPISVTTARQEVVSADLKLWLFHCTYHLGVDAGTWDTSATLRVRIVDGVASLELVRVEPFRPNVGHHDWGCELQQALVATIVGAILGPLGAAGALVTMTVGIDALIGNAIDQSVRRLDRVLATRTLPPRLAPLP